jgi:hypothetical protein
MRGPLLLRKRGGSMSLVPQVRANMIRWPSSVAMSNEASAAAYLPLPSKLAITDCPPAHVFRKVATDRSGVDKLCELLNAHYLSIGSPFRLIEVAQP